MAGGSRFKKGGMIGKLVQEQIANAPQLLNAIDFIESIQGFNVELFPIQRMIVKAIFAVPFDYKPKPVPMFDVFREKLIRIVSEEECLHILHEEGRCNVGDWRDIPERGYNEACIIAGRRGGKLLSVDEPIPTPNGFIRNGDLKDGDKVFGEDGKIYHAVIAHPIVQEDAYRVEFDDGTFTYAHAGHLWSTFTHKERKNSLRRLFPREFPKAVPGLCACGCGAPAPISKRNNPQQGIKKGDTQRFIRGHQLRMPRHSTPITGAVRTTEEVLSTLKVKTNSRTLQSNHAIRLPEPIDMPETCLPVEPYFLGCWLGDGNSATPAITTIDPEIRDLCYATAAAYELKVNPVPKKGTECLTYHISAGKAADGCRREGRNPLLTALQYLGVIDNKHIPQEYLWASVKQRLDLLQGLMDTDGSCAKDGQAEFCNTTRALADGVYHLAASLGLKPHWHEGTAKVNGKDCGPKYKVIWTSTIPVFRLKRKLERIPKKVKTTQKWRYITSIKPVGKMKMRCITTDNPTGLYLFGKNFNVTHNSEVVAAIGGYQLYRLLNHKSPQEYFGLVPGSPIDFTFLAQDDSGSNRLYNKLREGVNRAPFFGPYLKNSGNSVLRFVTESDRGKPEVTPTVICESRPCSTNATRSPSNVFLALDEFAHFRSEVGSTSDEVYGAAKPSTANFHHAELLSGEWISKKTMQLLPPEEYREFQDSLVISISSPMTRVGKMYELHKLALEKGTNSNTFTMRVSTAEMNPEILSAFLHDEHETNAMTFKAEYGGQFLDSSETYVTEAQIRACTDVQYTEEQFPKPIPSSARLNLTRFHPSCVGRQYFWGIDLGMMKNATAVAIGHLEHTGGKNPITLVYDYIDRMMVGEKFDGPGVEMFPGVEKYVKYQALPLEDILLWLRALNRVMPCYRGVTDQHGGQQLVQLLEINQIYNVDLLNLTTVINSQMAFSLKGYMDNRRCRFPFVPKFMDEIRLVEAEYVGKYQIRVQAPQEKGATDDMCDAVEEVAWVAQKWLMEEGGLRQDPGGTSLAMQEQLMKTPVPIMNLDSISMTEIKVIERMRKLQGSLMMSPGTSVVRNPFNVRGNARMGGRGRR